MTRFIKARNEKIKKAVEVLYIEEQVATELIEDSSWYYYEATKNNETVESFIILEEGLTLEEAAAITERHLESTNFVKISDVKPEIRELIENCHGSDNEMWFVEEDDEFWGSLSDKEIEKYEEEVEKLGLKDYIAFGEDGCLITVSGDISSVVNFHESEV